ncbi:cytochrome O ubiquinol oxidase [Sporolactobacillus sp. THM7-7]|nr:cytochrome O ubiquinol oxidase [Sporolactobacillus sp. THM7-7]
MSSITWVIDVFLHIDTFLLDIVNQYGVWTYALLFTVVFTETGLVICPFLPGESLLFAAGAIAAHNGSGLNIWLLLILICLAAILGDTVNYWIGRELGGVLEKRHLFHRMINEEKMERAKRFFNQYGGFAVFLGRFIPFIRTFIPFIAGGSRMNYSFFFFYNVLGGAVWTLAGLLAGYFFGQIPFIKENFSIIVILIVFLSVIPILLTYIKSLITRRRES